MSCNVKLNVTEYLIEEGAINNEGIVLDMQVFNKLNKEQSVISYNKYDVGEGTNLFTPELKRDGSYLAKPNTKLFDILQMVMDNSTPEIINYNLKAVKILQSQKAIDIFNKGLKNNWTINKILTELQIPKEQKEIIINKNLDSRDEILTSLLADNSFVVEVKVTKDIDFRQRAEFIEVDPGADMVELDVEGYEDVGEGGPSSHYEQLTVPGGVNYTENEISTPAITPNIKGHAQFSTDNGIGWFRSDEQGKEERISEFTEFKKYLNRFRPEIAEQEAVKQEKSLYWNEYLETKEIGTSKKEVTKTRRILEVQSDLFQKGRDKKDLVSPRQIVKDVTFVEKEGTEDSVHYGEDENGYFIHKRGTIRKIISLEEYKKYTKGLIKVKQNQFLQLLNKKGNWIQFFIQSIVQDSVQKGYEKVLFPTGETAAKVEGHDILEDKITKKKNTIESLKNVDLYKEPDGTRWAWKTKEGALISRGGKYYSTKERATSDIVDVRLRVENELKTLKTDGIEKLAPIEAFYSNRVTNILKKLYDVKVITDEHGNTWNGVKLEGKSAEEILLNVRESVYDANEKEKFNFTPIESYNEVQYNLANEKMFLAGEVKDSYKAIEILENIIANYDGKLYSSELLEKAKYLILKTKATVHLIDKKDLGVNENGEKAVMQYKSDTNKIEISLEVLKENSTNFMVESFLHEVFHSVMTNAYNNGSTIEDVLFKKFIDEAYEHYKSNTSNPKQHAFTDVQEFMALVFTSNSFQKEIKDLDKANNTNWWSRFVDMLRTLIGLPKISKSGINYNSVIEAIIENVNLERDYVTSASNTLFNVEEDTKSKYTKLDTLEDKLSNSVERMNESLNETLRYYNTLLIREQEENKLLSISQHIETVTALQSKMNSLADINQASSIAVFVNHMNSDMDFLKAKFDTLNYSDYSSIAYFYERYKNYLIRYSVIDDLKDTLSAIKFDTTQDILSIKDLELLEAGIISAKGKHSGLEGMIKEVSKHYMKNRLNNIKYFNNLETKHRDRLRKEHHGSKLLGDVDAYITEMMTGRDAPLIQKELTEAVQNYIESPHIDIMAKTVMSSTMINTNSRFVQIMNNLLMQITNERLKTERIKDVEFKKAYDKLVKEKGTIDINKLYKNIMEFDSDGKAYLKSEYNSKFLTDFYYKLVELRKEKIEITKDKGLGSPEFKAIKNKIKAFKSANLNQDSNGILISIKSKWKNDLSKLTKTEKEVLDLFREVTETSKKGMFHQQSLIKYAMETTFYEFPKISKSDAERAWANKGKGIISDKFKDLTQVRADDVGYITENIAADSSQIRKLKIHYRGKLENKDQSYDLFNIYRSEYKNGNTYSIRAKYETDLTMLIDVAKGREYYPTKGIKKINKLSTDKFDTIKGEQSQTVQMLTNILESNFYDVMNHTGTKLFGADLNKVVGGLNSVSAFLALSLNLASNTANVINANAQLFLESFMKGHHITAKSIAKANVVYGKDMLNIMSDVTNGLNISFVNQVMELFQAKGEFDLSQSNFLKASLLKRGLSLDVLQLGQDSGEHWVGSIITMSVLFGIKVMNSKAQFINKNGIVVKTKEEAASIMDMLITDEDGLVTLSDKIVYTTHSRMSTLEDGGKVKIDALVSKKLYDSIGAYRQLDQPEMFRHWLGKLVNLFRRYLITMGQARFIGLESSYIQKEDLEEDQRHHNDALQEYEEGTYTTLIRYLATAFHRRKLSMLGYEGWNELSQYEQHNIKRATLEFTMIHAVLPLSVMFVKTLAADDDSEELYFIAYQLRRLETELSQFSSFGEAIKVIRSPIPATRILETGLDGVSKIVNPIYWSSWGDVYEGGRFKGENKMRTKWKKQNPFFKESMRNYKVLLEFQESNFGKGL